MGDWPTQGVEPADIMIFPGSRTCLCDALTAVGGLTTHAWQGSGFVLYVPFTTNEIITIVKMVVFATVASGNIDVGIYDDQQNRLINNGSVAMALTAGNQTFDITDTTLLPGLYYMALGISTVAATVRGWVPQAGLTNAFGIMQQSVALPLPSTATFASNASTNVVIPMVCATARTVI